MNIQFEWNHQKADKNFKKHKVNFQEAKTVFRDSLAFIFDDEVHSINENREIIIGHSDRNRLLIICFTERVEGIVRIYSARPAIRKERKEYEQNKKIRFG